MNAFQALTPGERDVLRYALEELVESLGHSIEVRGPGSDSYEAMSETVSTATKLLADIGEASP